MALKPIDEKDRLYFEMKALHRRIGQVLKEYEAHLPTQEKPDKGRLKILDPKTGKPFGKGVAA